MSNQYFDNEGEQQYQYTNPIKFPDGSEITCYSSPNNRRMLIKHSSGSHIEFKNDGTLVVKAVKDLHLNSSVNSATMGDGNEDASITNIKAESDLNLNVAGKLTISCKEFDLVAKDTAKMNTSGDFKVKANNIISTADEQISLEGVKSTYISTGELREKVVTRTSEVGTMEGPANNAPTGGQVKQSVMGHFVLENLDPKGGITIKSSGYMNIVSAAERIDLTGHPAAISPVFDPTPFGLATYTHIVGPNPGPTPKGVPGSAYFQCGPGPNMINIFGPETKAVVGPTFHSYAGPFNEVYGSAKVKTVGLAEKATITNAYVVTAAMIFLN